jgi:excinuclease ABC subunit A
MDEVLRAKRQPNAGSASRAITIRGAREHNLKNIDVEIPRDKLAVFTGLSGSGKSSLAFDTIYAEGQRRYVESLSAYARQFLEMMQKPDVDQIDGLSPAISIEQKTTSKNPRSTVGTVTEIYDYMRLLWARVGVPYSPATGCRSKARSSRRWSTACWRCPKAPALSAGAGRARPQGRVQEGARRMAQEGLSARQDRRHLL